VYALSAALQINVSPEKVNRDVLMAAMKDKILASGELHVVYSRPKGSAEKADDGHPCPPPPRDRPNDPDSKSRQNETPPRQ
jgi:hypothetical protein